MQVTWISLSFDHCKLKGQELKCTHHHPILPPTLLVCLQFVFVLYLGWVSGPYHHSSQQLNHFKLLCQTQCRYCYHRQSHLSVIWVIRLWAPMYWISLNLRLLNKNFLKIEAVWWWNQSHKIEVVDYETSVFLVVRFSTQASFWKKSIISVAKIDLLVLISQFQLTAGVAMDPL